MQAPVIAIANPWIPYHPAFMSQVALQALADPRQDTVAREHRLDSAMVDAWRRHLETRAEDLFGNSLFHAENAAAGSNHRSSELRNATLEHMEVSIAIIEGTELRYQYANKAYQSLAPQTCFLGRRMREVFPMAMDEELESRFIEVLLTGRPWDIKNLQSRVSGNSDAVWEGKVTRLPLAEGAAPAIVIWLRNVAASLIIEESLRRKISVLQAIGENSTDVMFAKDRSGRMQYANPAALKLIGKALEDVLGKTDLEFLQDEEAAASVMSNDRRIMESGVAEEVEETVPMPDGTERVWLSQKRAYCDADGRVVGLLGVSRDITDRKYYEIRTREAHDALERVLGSITDGLAVLDRGWNFTYFSETGARILGVRSDELLGEHLWDLFSHADELAFGREYRRAMETGIAAHFEEFYPEPLNKWLECHCYPSSDGLSVYFRDVTDRRNAQDAATESRLRINALLEATPVGLAYADADGRILVMNSEAHRIWGNPPGAENINEYSSFLGWWADHSEKHGQPLRPHEWPTARALGGEQVVDIVLEIQPFDTPGTRRLVVHRSVPIFDDSGQITGAVTAMTDITESVALKRAVVESNHQIEQLANTIPQLAWMADSDGAVHWFNERWLEYTGGEHKDMEGWGWASVHDPEVLPRVIEKWRHSLDHGTAFEMTFPIKGKDGQFRPFYVLAEPLKDLDGRVVKWFGTCTDVSTLQQVQEDLTKAQNWLQEGLETGRMVAWEWDFATNEIRYSENAATVLGYGGGTFNHGIATVHEDGRQAYQKAIDRAIAERGSFDEITQRVRPDSGKLIWVRSKGVVLAGESDTPYGIRGILMDVTEQVQREQALEESSNRKDEFLAMLAHELRNPLAPISTAAQLLMMGGADQKRVKSSSEIIARQIGHMTRLVDDLLDVSRVTRGAVELESEPVQIMDIVNNAIEQSRPLIAARSHELTLHIVSTPAVVFGDRIRLCQVLVNLLNNAAKYTPQHGSIILDISVTTDEVTVAVEDNGIGMERALLPRVFELFTQATRTPDRAQGGLGLGLALVDSLVRMHGGRVEAFSEGIGKGSRVAFTLPLMAQLAGNKSEIMGAADDLSASRERPLSVLVVDDNVDAANMLAEILTLQGHAVAVGYSSAEALALAAERSCDLYVLDIGLPDIDGFELARQLRAMPGNADAVLVAVTGYGQPHDKVLSRAAGFDHHLVKPVDIAHLDSIVRLIKA